MKIARSKPAKRKGRSRKGDGSLKLRGRIWWYVIPDPLNPGCRIEKSCDTTDYQKALDIKRDAIVRTHSPRGRGMETPTTVGKVLDEYAVYAERHRARSWRSLKVAIRHLREAFGAIPATALTTADTDQFRDDRIAADSVSDSTVNRELGYLRAALRRLTRETPPRLGVVPYMRTPSEKDCVREGFIEREDYRCLLGHLPIALQAIFVCAFHTGARSGELKVIEWRQINWEQMIIELRPKTTKNADGRWIPIWGDMREYLLRQKAMRDRTFPDCPWVFFWPEDYHPRATPGDRLRDFRRAWSEACTRAGFPDLLFHDLRRSAIRFADQEAGISPTLVRKMSGHKTESVYLRYNIAGGKDIGNMGRDLDRYLAEREKKVVAIRSA